MNIDPAIAILVVRRATNGYADLPDLAAACGIDVNAEYSYAECLEMHDALVATGCVSVSRGNTISGMVEYRMMA